MARRLFCLKDLLANLGKQDRYHAKTQGFRFTNGEMFGIIRIDQDKKGMFL
jgi:hypothetical protein